MIISLRDTVVATATTTPLTKYAVFTVPSFNCLTLILSSATGSLITLLTTSLLIKNDKLIFASPFSTVIEETSSELILYHSPVVSFEYTSLQVI